jgi:hypothetical protein
MALIRAVMHNRLTGNNLEVVPNPSRYPAGCSSSRQFDGSHPERHGGNEP